MLGSRNFHSLIKIQIHVINFGPNKPNTNPSYRIHLVQASYPFHCIKIPQGSEAELEKVILFVLGPQTVSHDSNHWFDT